MKLNSTTCKEKYIGWLTGIPHEWKCRIAEAMCSSMDELATVDCDQVKECETLTSLSTFTVIDSSVCIVYTDEEGTEVTRCFDFNDVLNNSLESVDPNCLSTAEEWANLSFTGKFQAIVDKICQNCDE